jgi:hypothetical protein
MADGRPLRDRVLLGEGGEQRARHDLEALTAAMSQV